MKWLVAIFVPPLMAVFFIAGIGCFIVQEFEAGLALGALWLTGLAACKHYKTVKDEEWHRTSR